MQSEGRGRERRTQGARQGRGGITPAPAKGVDRGTLFYTVWNQKLKSIFMLFMKV